MKRLSGSNYNQFPLYSLPLDSALMVLKDLSPLECLKLYEVSKKMSHLLNEQFWKSKLDHVLKKDEMFCFIPMKNQLLCQGKFEYIKFNKCISDHSKIKDENFILINDFNFLSKIESIIRDKWPNHQRTPNISSHIDGIHRELYKKIDKRLWTDKEFVLNMSQHSNLAMDYASKELLFDKDFVLKAIPYLNCLQVENMLKNCDQAFFSDEMFVLSIAPHCSGIIDMADEKFFSDLEFISKASKINRWCANKALSKEGVKPFLSDKKFILEIIPFTPDILKYLPAKISSDMRFKTLCFMTHKDKYKPFYVPKEDVFYKPKEGMFSPEVLASLNEIQSQEVYNKIVEDILKDNTI